MTEDLDPRRSVPSVDRVLQALGAEEGLPHELLADVGRAAVDAARERAVAGEAVTEADVVADARARAGARRAALLRPLVNATGVIVHTNLGRAPLADGSLAAVAEVAGGYSNLE